MNKSIDAFLIENKIGYVFNDKTLLCTAFTHSSYANEHKVESNERLEFLGDAIVSYIVSEILYEKFPKKREDFLTETRKKIVGGKAESEAFIESDLIDEMRFGGNGKPDNQSAVLNIYENLFEAIVAAIYLDNGIEESKKFIFRYLGAAIKDPESQKSSIDYKSELISVCQKLKKECRFVLDSEDGPSHKKNFLMHVEVDGVNVGSGKGVRKKEAEQNAAAAALKGFKSVD